MEEKRPLAPLRGSACGQFMNKKDIYPGYKKWLDKTDDLFRRFALLSRHLESFMLDHVLQSKENAELLASRLVDVFKNCDTVDYDEPGVVEAYVILHFLDRFHRFQLILLDLLEQGLLPIKSLAIDALDVGTGPAHALFALSDMYSGINLYAQDARDQIPTLALRNDCIEYSKRFGEWLHAFARYTSEIDGRRWDVPYYGTSSDFHKHDPRVDRNRYFESCIEEIQRDFLDDDDSKFVPSRTFVVEYLLGSEWKNYSHYDLVCFSNFLTEETQVKNLSVPLRSTAEALRNGGIIVVVGGPGAKYDRVYAAVKDVLCSGRYLRKRSVARMTEIKLKDNEMQYSLAGGYGDILRAVLGNVLDRIREHGAEHRIDALTLKQLQKSVRGAKGQRNWALHVYRKTTRSRIKS